MYIVIDDSTLSSIEAAVCAGEHLPHPGGRCPESLYNTLLCPCWRLSDTARPNFDWVMCKLAEEAMIRGFSLQLM